MPKVFHFQFSEKIQPNLLPVAKPKATIMEACNEQIWKQHLWTEYPPVILLKKKLKLSEGPRAKHSCTQGTGSPGQKPGLPRWSQQLGSLSALWALPRVGPEPGSQTSLSTESHWNFLFFCSLCY